MDSIVKMLVEKVGITEVQAAKVLDLLKDLAGNESFLGKSGMADKLKGLFGGDK